MLEIITGINKAVNNFVGVASGGVVGCGVKLAIEQGMKSRLIGQAVCQENPERVLHLSFSRIAFVIFFQYLA